MGRGEGYVIAKDCMGYYWLRGDATARAERIRQQHPEIASWTLVSNLGVNDLSDMDQYIQYYRHLEELGYRVVIVSVNPSDGKRKDSNKDIDTFNKKMSESGLEYLNLCGHLREIGFNTTDGLHYQKDTNLEIWNEINTSLASGWGKEGEGHAADTALPAEGAGQPVKTEYSGWLCKQPEEADGSAQQPVSGNQ